MSRHRNVYPLFYDLFESIENKVNHSKNYNLFSHWITDEDALRVETQDINITRAEVTEIYRRFFGPSTPEPDIFVTQANTNPLYHGGVAFFPAGASLEDFDRLREPLGRVFFAGDAYRMTTSYSGATRALYSGNEPAFALIDCMNNHSCSMTPYATPSQCPKGTVFLSIKHTLTRHVPRPGFTSRPFHFSLQCVSCHRHCTPKSVPVPTRTHVLLVIYAR